MQGISRSKQKSTKTSFANLRMFAWIFRLSPGYVIGYLGYALCINLPTFLCNVFLFQFVVDRLEIGGREGEIAAALLLITVFLLLGNLYTAWFSHQFRPKIEERILTAVRSALYDKAENLDLAAYETPDFYNRFVLAMDAADQRALAAVTGLCDLLANVVNVLLTTTIFLAAGSGVFLIAACSVGCTLLMNRIITKREGEKRKALLPLTRRRDYCRSIFQERRYAQELRFYEPLFSLFSGKFKESSEKLEQEGLKWNRRLYPHYFIQDFIPNSLLLSFLLILYLGYQVMVAEAITYGTFVAVFNGVQVMVSTINRILGVSVLQYALNARFLADFYVFLDTDPTVISGQVSVGEASGFIEAPEAAEARFVYPQSEDPAIDGLSFASKGIRRIAVVGYNSAGKSTLMKLLVRLYDVSEGSISWNGRKIQEYQLSEYRRLFAVMPQDIHTFAATLAENVAMDIEYDPDRVWAAVEQSGLAEFLPSGRESMTDQMTKEFSADGLVLSGGQQQKLALARAYYQDSPILILDEPSASLDPEAEYQLNQQVAVLSRKKVVLYVSHRLTTVRMADEILMMEKGRIVERGSHQELLAQNGKYAEMWRAQAEKYRLGMAGMNDRKIIEIYCEGNNR